MLMARYILSKENSQWMYSYDTNTITATDSLTIYMLAEE